MKVFSLLDDFNTDNCSCENNLGWFWLLEPRYTPHKKHGGCHRVYSIFRHRSKKDNKETFVAYVESNPVLYSHSYEDLLIQVDLYDMTMRFQG